MADPATAFAGLSLAGAGLSAIGTLQAADARSKAADYEARISEEQAGQVEVAAAERARMTRKAGRQLTGTEAALYAKSGVQVGTGTPLEIMAASAREVELDALKTEYAGRVEATNLRRQAVLTRYGAKIGKREASIGSVGTLLSGGGRALLIGSSGRSGPSGPLKVPDSGPLYSEGE